MFISYLRNNLSWWRKPINNHVESHTSYCIHMTLITVCNMIFKLQFSACCQTFYNQTIFMYVSREFPVLSWLVGVLLLFRITMCPFHSPPMLVFVAFMQISCLYSCHRENNMRWQMFFTHVTNIVWSYHTALYSTTSIHCSFCSLWCTPMSLMS